MPEGWRTFRLDLFNLRPEKLAPSQPDINFCENFMDNPFSLIGKLFKRNLKLTKVGLDEAKEKGLVTEEEYLMLKSKRADEEYKEFLKKQKK